MPASLHGTRELRRAARLVREADEQLQADIRQAVRGPIDGFRSEVRAEVPQSVPSGYAPVLVRDLHVSVSGAGNNYEVKVSARGRDVRAIDRGIMRHPTYGHQPWVAQRIRGGFVARPAEKLGRAIEKAVRRAIARAARTIERAG